MQAYYGNTGNSHSRELSRISRDSYEDASASSFYLAPPANPVDAPKAQWTYDFRNAVPLRAPLEQYVPKSQWNFSPYTASVDTVASAVDANYQPIRAAPTSKSIPVAERVEHRYSANDANFQSVLTYSAGEPIP